MASAAPIFTPPIVPGNEIVGRVTAVGQGIKVGERIGIIGRREAR